MGKDSNSCSEKVEVVPELRRGRESVRERPVQDWESRKRSRLNGVDRERREDSVLRSKMPTKPECYC